MLRRSVILALTASTVALGILVLVTRHKALVPADTVILPLQNFALNLDPATMVETESRKVGTLIYAGLIAVDQDGRVQPRIARAWHAPRPGHWIFNLRTDVRFSNGVPVTADKVIRSLCAAMQPSHVQSSTLFSIDRTLKARGGVDCTGLSSPDPATVVVNETRPTPWLLDALSGPGGWIVDVDAKPAAYGVRPGIGPYVVSVVQPERAVVLTARPGGAVVPRSARIEFRYAPDPILAAQLFQNGYLDLLELTSPRMADQLLGADGMLKRPDAVLEHHPVDAVRVVLFNLTRLERLGLSSDQIRSFMAAYSAAVPRARIVEASNGLAVPLFTGFPPARNVAPPDPPGLLGAAPLQLRLFTENVPFDDMVGALLPQRMGQTQIDYEAVDKSLLITSILKGDYDLALIRVEASWASPRFWSAFFSPMDPYTAFGRGIAGMNAIDFSTADGVEAARRLVESEGNWVGVIREVGAFARSKRVNGVRLTRSGQLSLETIGPS